MSNRRPVSVELHHEIEQFLYREARMLDREMLREWLDTVVAPEVRYQMVIREERFRKDRSGAAAKDVMPYDDDYRALDLRVRQFETGLQTMLDPPQRMRRILTNVAAYYHDKDGEYLVLWDCLALSPPLRARAGNIWTRGCLEKGQRRRVPSCLAAHRLG
jgi:3-phenylpropionate/cinnamic acid dioxygenase small subunit